MSNEEINNLTVRVLNQTHMRQVVQDKFSNLSSEKTDWQYCKVEKLIQEKEEYDKMRSWKKLENATVNKFDSFTGQPFDTAKKE